jgi:hypothetical protein
MTEFNEAQLKLAQEVLGNFEATIQAGYWVEYMSDAYGRDEKANPAALTIYDAEGEEMRVHREDVAEAFVKVLNGEVRLRKDLRKTIGQMWLEEDYLGGEFGIGGDFETDDVLVQIAAYGEVVWG